MSIRLDHHVKQKQCMKPLGIIISINLILNCLIVVVVSYHHLGTSFSFWDSMTVTLIFILTADWQVQTVVQKDGSLTNQQFPKFKCSAHVGVQKYFWTRGPNTM